MKSPKGYNYKGFSGIGAMSKRGKKATKRDVAEGSAIILPAILIASFFLFRKKPETPTQNP